MKPLLLVIVTVFSTFSFAQNIQLENLTYGKKESRFIFVVDNVFKISGKDPVVGLEYDKSLVDVTLKQDSLTIQPIYKVHYPDRTSNWDGKNNELIISFLTATGKEDIKFQLKKLPHPFPAILAQPEYAEVDKESLVSSKKVEIMTTTPDHEGFFKNYKILELEVLVNNISYKISGDGLNDDVLTAIKGARSGDKISLQQVKTIDDVTNRKINFLGPTIYVLK